MFVVDCVFGHCSLLRCCGTTGSPKHGLTAVVAGRKATLGKSGTSPERSPWALTLDKGLAALGAGWPVNLSGPGGILLSPCPGFGTSAPPWLGLPWRVGGIGGKDLLYDSRQGRCVGGDIVCALPSAFLDFGKGPFHVRSHEGIAYDRRAVFDDIPAKLGGQKGLALLFDVAAQKEGLYDASPGCDSAKALGFFKDLLVLCAGTPDVALDVFHGVYQGAFRKADGWRSHGLFHCHVPGKDLLVLRNPWQDNVPCLGVLLRFFGSKGRPCVPEGCPARAFLHPAVRAPQKALAAHVHPGPREDVGRQKLPGVAAADEGVDLGLALAQALGRLLRGDNGVVGADLAGVPGSRTPRAVAGSDHVLHALELSHCLQHSRSVCKLLDRQILAVRARIGDELCLVHALAGLQGGLRAQTIPCRGLLLQLCEIVG